MIAVVVVIIAIGAGVGAYFVHQNKKMEEYVNRDVIYEGITIQGINVGGLTKEEALYEVGNVMNENIFNKEIRIYYGDNDYVKPYEFFEFTSNFEEVIDKAYNHFKSGKLKSRYKAIKKLETEHIDFPIENGYHAEKITEFIESIKNDFNVEVKDAMIHRENGAFVIADETVGLAFDVNENVAKVKEAVDNFKEEVTLVVTETKPKYTAAYYSNIKDVLGEYSTNHNNNWARTQNLKLASGKINGIILHPGEDLATHVVISPITKANGYRDAPIIKQGEVEDGTGGGVCQVATTLYNAVLFSELRIIERQNHSMPVSYVEKGKDATMYGNQIDFVFENSTKYPMYVESFVSGGKVHMRLYGRDDRSSKRTLKFKPVVLQKIDPPKATYVKDDTLLAGQEVVKRKGINGYKVKLYKYIYEDGKLMDKQLVNSSYYRPVGPIIRVGTKQPADAPITDDGAVQVDGVESGEAEPTMAPVDDTSSATPTAPTEPEEATPAPSEPTEAPTDETPATPPTTENVDQTGENLIEDAQEEAGQPSTNQPETNEGVDVDEAGEGTGNNP